MIFHRRLSFRGMWLVLVAALTALTAKAEGIGPTFEPPNSQELAPSQNANEGSRDAADTAFAPLTSLSNASDANPLVLSESENLAQDLEALTRELNTVEKSQTLRAIQDARDIVAGRGQYSNLLCLPSISKPGKSCMKSVSGDTTCVGNYFDTVAMCKISLATSRDRRACYQSESKPGKGFISLMDPTSQLIGNYYSSYDGCVTSMKYTYGPLVCMESARYASKWFIANLDQNADQFGGYTASFAECVKALGFDDYVEPTKLFTKPSEVDAIFSMVGVAGSYNWGGGKEYWINTEVANQFGSKQLFIREGGEIFAWNPLDKKGFLASGGAIKSVQIAKVDVGFYARPHILIAGIDDPTPPVASIIGLASELDDKLQLSGSGTNLNWAGASEYWIYTNVLNQFGQKWVYILPNGEVWEWNSLDKKGFLAVSGGTVRSALVAKLNPDFYANLPMLIAGIDGAADVDKKFAFKGVASSFNWGGMNEKWFKGKTHQFGEWYFILPSGVVYSWNPLDTKAVIAQLKGSVKIAKVSDTYYTDIAALINAFP